MSEKYNPTKTVRDAAEHYKKTGDAGAFKTAADAVAGSGHKQSASLSKLLMSCHKKATADEKPVADAHDAPQKWIDDFIAKLPGKKKELKDAEKDNPEQPKP